MKTIVSLLLVLCLVSCSQPRPSPNYESLKTSSTKPAVAAAPTNPQAVVTATNTTTDETMEEAAPESAMASNQVAEAAVPSNSAAEGTNAVASPFAHPAQPAIPAQTHAAAATTNAPFEPLLPAYSINFQGVPVDKVLQVYAEYVQRTLLRSPSVNGQTLITLVQQTPLTKTEIIHALDAELAMNNIAMIPIGEKFIKVVNLQEASGVGGKIDQINASLLPEFGPFETRVVQLKYTKPSEMQGVLQQFTKTPSAVLPIESSGMLVLRDSVENVKRMLEMIDMLDTTVPENIESAVIPIKYALAADIASALNSLSGSGGGGSFGGRGSGARGTMGVGRGAGQGSGFGNTGGAGGTGGYGGQGTTGALGGVGGGGLGGNAAPGTTGGAASQSFTDRVRNLVQAASGGAGGKGEFQILGQTKIIADERMNALLVFAAHEDMERIKSLVKQLDVVLPQVLIEAIIMEVTLDNSRTLGVSAAQNPIGNHNVYVGGFNNGQQFFPFGGNGGSNSFPGNFTSTLPGNQLSYWGNFGNNFQVAVQAAESDSRVHVLSEPRIQTSHGVEADLFVGETIPYVNSTTAGAFGGTGVYNSYEQQQIGVTLKVKPLINPDGLVVMDIYQEASEPGPSSTAVDINGTSVPTINQRQASATVAVKDRDTIILGGMISTTQSKTKSGVPYLKDIPLLGNLFRSTADSGERVELIVLLRPTVLPTPEVAASVAKAEQRNLPGVRRAEAEIRAEEAVRLRQADEELDHLGTNGIASPY